ncbi:MAG: adenylosuccinate lyase [Armatimonadota bacterium]|nr:adenylosuccinate lyase [Armatimonadota bacterium]MCX7777607.1 adenylosuccinate lyase [Armatimonadota bacterium]MDW8024715.1 adenylosuccinate lyase [Armatimonadota bacterium]
MWERYSYPQMRELWTLEAKFNSWMEVELAICDALSELGYIPKEAAKLIRERASFKVERVLELERVYHHDLIAFVKAMTENMGDEGRYVHMGVTSYDVEDTALGLRMKRACEILIEDVDRLIDALKVRAVEHKDTIMMGRTHGVHAEPITFGLKLCVWITEMQRHRERLERVKDIVGAGKISGAVGTYATIDPRVEEIVLQRLGLKRPLASTQILQRDRHAEYICVLAIIAASLEKFATEIRNLQRTEILEVEEPFAKEQRGSSAMPHKRNPHKCEQICGLARLVRAHVIPALENIATWHERDLTNSSVERVTIPEASILVDYMLRRFTEIISGMVVYPNRMKRNMELTHGMICSQRVMLKLVEKGWSRDEAYTVVQSAAFSALEQERHMRDVLLEDERVRKVLSDDELDECFDYSHFVRHVDMIFERMGLI